MVVENVMSTGLERSGNVEGMACIEHRSQPRYDVVGRAWARVLKERGLVVKKDTTIGDTGCAKNYIERENGAHQCSLSRDLSTRFS